MIRHHFNCKIDRCEVCLKDHDNLAQYLKNITFSSASIDILSEYRKYLDGKNIKSEGEDGWGNEEAFKDENINNFCYDYFITHPK